MPSPTEAATVNALDSLTEELLYEQLKRNFWYPVAYSAEVGDRPMRVVLCDEQLVLVRLGGALRLFPDLCLHRGTALSLGEVRDDCLECPYHGWRYDSEGRVVRIPAREELSGRIRAQLVSYPVAEACGMVFGCLGEPRFSLPEFPERDDPSYRITEFPPYEWDCSMARRLENYFDFSHFSFVHDGILGDSSQPRVDDYDARRVGGEIRFTAGPFVEYTDNVKNSAVSGGTREIWHATKRYRVFMPNGLKLNSSAGPNGEDYCLFWSLAPVTRKRTRAFTVLARNYAFDKDDAFWSFQYVILDQDKPIVESQRPEELPVDMSAELYVRGADLTGVLYRRWLLEFAHGRFELAPEE